MTSIKTVAIVAALALGATPALAQSQLAASAGLSQSEAAGLSLQEIAAAKFSRDTENAQRIVVPGSGGNADQLAASAGLAPGATGTLGLNQIAAAKFSRDTENAHRIVERGSVTASARSVAIPDRTQLISAAGLDADETRGLSLDDVVAAKFARDTWN